MDARVLVFCVVLLLSPLLYEVGLLYAGDLEATVLTAVVIGAAVLYAYLGDDDRSGGSRSGRTSARLPTVG